MRYSVSVLVRSEADAEAGNLDSELWFTGTAEVPEGAVPSAVLFPGEGEVALFPLTHPHHETSDSASNDPEEPAAPDNPAVPEAAEPDQTGQAKKGK